MAHAQLAFGIDRPSTLDEALNVIERLSGSFATLSIQAKTLPVGHTRCEDCGEYLGNDRGALSHEISRLVSIRRAIKAGDGGEAMYQLESLLSELDSGWRCLA